MDATVDAAGRLAVGGCDLAELAAEYGTPAYVYSEADLRARARAYREAFGASGDAEVLYASKAAPITAICALFAAEGLSVDVASGGELAHALAGGFEPARIYMHGNNKSESELRAGLDAGIGYFVCDSLEEIALLDRLCAERDHTQEVLIRVTPGIHADTHSYVQTGQEDSKFGLGLNDGSAAAGIAAIRGSSNLTLVGLHSHIGSQVFDLEPYAKAVAALAGLASEEFRILNVGGGVGVAYVEGDRPPTIGEFADRVIEAVRESFPGEPRILVEPGRSLVANAGLTLYRVGTVKQIEGVRRWVSVDGGMSDNLRPMLYDSPYSALIADRAEAAGDEVVTVAGKHCESGDVLIEGVSLPSPRVGDVLVTPATGAYGHAMASNYNAIPRPPVIFCADGDARVVVRRETESDLLRRDVGA
ncbi:diaminopimelate decarboxylase [Thermoleophilia bacterium SCSIO 60948]|nr:diaminopimelate decarboxylase [Thermoleophilia bacterium SCSIO 60948]